MQLPFRRSGSLGLLAAVATLGACSPAPVASRDPQFAWFEYTGNDSVYDRDRAGPGEYHNPILAGFYPDPSICRAGDDYYLVSSSFSYFPGVPIFQSRDLVNWTQIGHILDRPSQLGIDTLGISRGIFAPTIRFHDGTFYMLTTFVDGGGNFVVTATDPAGPWSEPVFLGFDGIDPDVFFDDNGKAYILNNGPPEEAPRYDGHRAIWIQEFDPKARAMVGPRKLIIDGGVDIRTKPIWIEAPHVLKVDGWYYLIAAEGGTADQHSEVVFRSRSVLGPYIPFAGNPILTQRHLDPTRPDPITSTGHADFVQTQTGDWWAVFLGTRPYSGDFYNTGRETFLLPVTWRDGWPLILARDLTVPYRHARPDLPAQPAPAIPTSGNFTQRDEFADSTLQLNWHFIRTPREQWYSLDSGSLSMRARNVALTDRGQPSFIGRRQQHLSATATTAMHYRPQAPGDRAGLVVFQNDEYFFLLGVGLADGKPAVLLERHAGDSLTVDRAIVASAPLPEANADTVYLRIEAKRDRYDFSYAVAADAWVVLKAGVDGTILSTKSARGFVGALFGLYAYSPSP
ncbi:MAG: glycoside hydrolase family 43 protein [Gemmatimonadaceae bacterium]